jgi:hypothetical protein
MVIGLVRGLAQRFGVEVEVSHQPRPAGCDHDVFLIRRRG